MIEVTLKKSVWGKQIGETKKVSLYKATWAEKTGLIEPFGEATPKETKPKKEKKIKTKVIEGYQTKDIKKGGRPRKEKA